jgi:hypothetical protein
MGILPTDRWATSGPRPGHNQPNRSGHHGHHRPAIYSSPGILPHPPQVDATLLVPDTEAVMELRLGITVETTENRERGSQAVQAPLR